jgi:hypothetical protein
MPDPRKKIPKEFGEVEMLETERANKSIASEEEAKAASDAVLQSREDRLGKREKRLADKGSNDLNMALIDAGLAMMQSRGQGLAGIAEGAAVGTKRYMEENRLTEAARQKAEEARDAYDDLKFNRNDMSRKQILAAKGKITDAQVATKKANVDYIAKQEDVNLKTAGHIYDANMADVRLGKTQAFEAEQKQLDRKAAAGIAGLNAQTQRENALLPGAQERLFKTLGGGDAKKGFDYYTTATAEGKGDQAIILAAMKDPMVLESLSPEMKKIVQQRMLLQMTPGMVSGAPAAGQVRAP